MTLLKLARLANVSVSTVSKAFSGSNDINEKTREMIFEVAKRNKCFKEFYNAKYAKTVIAVICPEYESRYYAGYLSAIQESLNRNNASMCVSVTDFDPVKETEAFDYYAKYAKADGVIAIGSSGGKLTAEFDIPIVALCDASNTSINTVGVNYRKGIDSVLKCFSENGHKNVGFIGEHKTNIKLKYFRESAKNYGLYVDDAFVSVSDERFELGGYNAMQSLFDKNNVPTAIFAAYDYMAIGAIRSIHEHGLSVPDDISVCGSDDIPEDAYLTPSLSSVRANIRKMCLLAVDIVLAEIHDGTGREKISVLVDSKFVKRDSISICKEYIIDEKQ